MEMLPYAVSSPECQPSPSPSVQVARIMWSVMNWPKPGAARISARRSGDTGLGFEVAANDRAMVATFLRRWRRGGEPCGLIAHIIPSAWLTMAAVILWAGGRVPVLGRYRRRQTRGGWPAVDASVATHLRLERLTDQAASAGSTPLGRPRFLCGKGM
ncbi:hypothetical protein BN10_610009 [Phycicoccus elongatus Lp2]|uniref:Uncharacterized protein n=1 Tax=Phycicoccus elongatus Lp2 TaxID=1193181 RepID=N0E0W3_9MICO|nr:hypothetical protein BN10_610009 [Phycicoccus elongatus Lp2]